MDLTDAENAIIDRVLNMVDAPNIVLPNDAELLATPRYVIQPSVPSQTPQDLDGVFEQQAEVMVRIEVDEDKFSGSMTTLTSQLVERFPPGIRFSGVRIREPPLPRGSFKEGGVYVRPVFIRGVFSTRP